MKPPFEPFDPSLLSFASNLLQRLGVSENYIGFRYAAYAVALCAANQDRLLLVTKWLYPDIANRFGTNPSCVERDLRTVITVAWERNPVLLAAFTHCPENHKPSCSQFIAALAYYLRSNDIDSLASASPNLYSE